MAMTERDTNALIGYGTQIQIPDPVTPEAWVDIEDLITSEPPDEQADDVEIITFDARGRTKQYIPGFIEPGEMSYSVNARPDLYETHRRILHSKETGATLNHQVITPAGETIFVPGYVKGLKRNLQPNDAYTWDVTIKVAGASETVIDS